MVRVVFSLLLCFCSFIFCIFTQAKDTDSKSRAKDMFFQQMSKPESRINNGVAFCIELHRKGQKPTLCSRKTKFKFGDGIKLHVKSNFDGYAHIILTAGTTGKKAVLFPPPGAGEDNHIERGKEYVIPSTGLLRFDNNPGVEKLQLIVSRDRIDSRTILASVKNINLSSNSVDSEAGFSIDEGGAKLGTRISPSTYIVNNNPSVAASISFGLHHIGSTEAPTIARPISENSTTQHTASGVNRPISDKWALCVGIGKFMDSNMNLKSPAKDALDLADFLVKEKNFIPGHVKTLVDHEATKSNIINSLHEWLGQRVRKDDLVVIYISSHGTDKSKVLGGNFIVPYDYVSESSGILMQDLGNLIKRQINSDRVVIILDVCFAANAKSKAMDDTKDYLAEILQGAGRIVVSSCDIDETSLDTFRTHKNSLFTYHLINAMREEPLLKKSFDKTRDAVLRESMMLRTKQTPVINYDKWQGNDVVLSAPPTDPSSN